MIISLQLYYVVGHVVGSVGKVLPYAKIKVMEIWLGIHSLSAFKSNIFIVDC